MPVPIERIIHINLNVSELAPASVFFTDMLGLQAISLMKADPQDGSGMGVDGQVQWSGQSIHSVDHLWDSTMIDLLEWPLPKGFGRAYQSPAHLGISSLAVAVPDVDDCYARLVASSDWLEPFSRPFTDTRGRRRFGGSNPDGSLIEIVNGRAHSALDHITFNVGDLTTAISWYQNNLGFALQGDILEEQAPRNAWSLDSEALFRSALMQLPGRDHDCALQLRQWTQPRAHGTPYREPNHNGFFRMAMAVDDCAGAYRQLLDNGADCPYPPVWLDMGPDIPVDGLWALFFYDPDGNCVELIQNPELNGV